MTKVVGSLNQADILTEFEGLRGYEENLKTVNVHVIARGRGRGGVGTDENGVLAARGRVAGDPRIVSWAGALDEEKSPERCAMRTN